MRLRNPWGNSEWEGAWGSESEEMIKYKETLEQYVATLPDDEQYDLSADDGTFIMHYDDWKDNFSTLFLNIDFPDHWSGIRFKSAWTSQNSGGLPTTYSKDMLERYAKNPQFQVTPVEDVNVMFSLSQTGGRLPVNGKYSNYPFAETLNYACMGVFKVPYGEKYLKAFDKNQLAFLSPIKRERENSGRVKLKGGETYIFVPSCEMAGTVGEFHISMYIDCAMRDVLCRRVFHPTDKNEANDIILPSFIPEENEKSSSRAPIWKKQLCKDMLPYMMTDEDTGMIDSTD
jgi:hypothetical protein